MADTQQLGAFPPFSGSGCTAEELHKLSIDAAENAIILNPNLPSVQLAQHIITDADPHFLAQMAHLLLLKHFVAAVRAVRMAKRKPQQPLLPGFEHLPKRVWFSASERIPIAKATFTEVRGYYRLLAARHRDRRQQDPKLAEAKRLMELMQEHARKRRGITVAEVLAL